MRATQYRRATNLPYSNLLSAFDDPSEYLARIKGEIASTGSFGAGVGCDEPSEGDSAHRHTLSLRRHFVSRKKLLPKRPDFSASPAAVQEAFELDRQQRQLAKQHRADEEWAAVQRLANDVEWQRSRRAHEGLMRRVDLLLSQPNEKWPNEK